MLDAVNNGVKGVVIIDGRKSHSILFELFSDKGANINQKMKNLKKIKNFILIWMDVYQPEIFKKFFGQVSKRMTEFISKLNLVFKIKAKEIQTDYFYKYNTSLNGLMKNYPDKINPNDFLKYVHEYKL